MIREINVKPPGATAGTTLCYTGCNTLLMLEGARPCAILLCSTCRKDPTKLAAARTENGKHMRAHTIHERQTNPWYPFPDLATAWSAA